MPQMLQCCSREQIDHTSLLPHAVQICYALLPATQDMEEGYGTVSGSACKHSHRVCTDESRDQEEKGQPVSMDETHHHQYGSEGDVCPCLWWSHMDYCLHWLGLCHHHHIL